jgi:hypothetical protein
MLRKKQVNDPFNDDGLDSPIYFASRNARRLTRRREELFSAVTHPR